MHGGVDPEEEVFVLFSLVFDYICLCILKKKLRYSRHENPLYLQNEKVLRFENLRFWYFLGLEVRFALSIG